MPQPLFEHYAEAEKQSGYQALKANVESKKRGEGQVEACAFVAEHPGKNKATANVIKDLRQPACDL